MLGRNQRLHHNKDFIRVFKQCKRHSFGGVLLYYRKNNLNHTRIGFIVSKKYSLLAVKRNKQRRVLQYAAKKLYPTIKPGFDIIISYTNRDKVLPYRDAVIALKKITLSTNLFITSNN